MSKKGGSEKVKPENKPPETDERPEAIAEWQEWQKNQFSPGHYTGGKQIPLLKNPGKPIAVGIILLFFGLITLIGGIANLADFNTHTDGLPELLPHLLILALAIIFLLAGYRMIRRGRKR